MTVIQEGSHQVNDGWDPAEAKRFLHWLDPFAHQFSFQTFDNAVKGARPDPSLAKLFYGPIEGFLTQELVQLNQRGSGVYVTVNETDGGGRSASNISSVRALWADFDGAPVENLQRLPVVPSCTMLTSPGKYQFFWLVKGVGKEEFGDLQGRLARLFGSDPAITDLPRVSRLPGFYNMKGKLASPHLVTCQYPVSRDEIDRDFFLTELEKAEADAGIRYRPRRHRKAIPFVLEDYELANIEKRAEDAINTFKAADCDRDTWLRFGLMLHSVEEVDLFKVWDDWSAKDSRYVDGECYRKWNNFERKPGGLSIRSLFYMATKRGWKDDFDWPGGHNKGKVKGDFLNTVSALKRLQISCSKNMFSQKEFVSGDLLEFPGPKKNDHGVELRGKIAKYFGFDPGKDNVFDALSHLAIENRYHPVLEYLDSLEWDGVQRIDTFLTDYFGVDDTPLTRAMSRVVLIAAVRRVRQPGCKFDHVLVLEGLQGIGKSSAIKALASPEWFSDMSILGLNDSKKEMELMSGVWIYELSELGGYQSAKDMNHLTAFISRTEERNVRRAYERTEEDSKRSLIFIGTTNQTKYLRDFTGNRRIWPVTCFKANYVGIRAVRDQLWAEAAEAERRWPIDEVLTIPEELFGAVAKEQEKRLDNPFTEMLTDVASIAKVVGSAGEYRLRVYTADIAEMLGVGKADFMASRRGVFGARRLRPEMEALGWEYRERITERVAGRKNVRPGYERKTSEEEVLDLGLPLPGKEII